MALLSKALLYLKARWFRGLLTLVFFGLAAAGGLRSTPWLATSLGFTAPKIVILHTPSPDIIPGVIKMIESAREEIVLSTPRIDDESVLKALEAAEGRGVRVVLVFSQDQVSRTAGCLGWLLFHKTCIVFTDSAPFVGTTFVMDRSVALVSSIPLTVKSRAAGSAGTAMFIRHREAVADLRDEVKKQAERGQPEREGHK